MSDDAQKSVDSTGDPGEPGPAIAELTHTETATPADHPGPASHRASPSADAPIAPTDTVATPSSGPGARRMPDVTGDVPGTPLVEIPFVDPDLYELKEDVGQGGMGRVIRAFDRRLGREVALKVLRPGSSDSTALRFEQEAMITARLEHPSIVPVHEAGRWPDGSPFYVMKLVEGKPLKDLLRSARTLPARLALLPHLLTVADALAYAHSKAIIHRDIKPSNVIVGDFGETVVIDWGLAKNLHASEDPDHDTPLEQSAGPQSVDLTRTGSVLGTPAYMAPEQARGQPADRRADVYALGAILYHILSGKLPRAAGRGSADLSALLDTPVAPLSEVATDLPFELLTIANKAMSPLAADRYPSAAAFAADLRRYHTGQLVRAHQYTRLQLTRRWLKRHRTLVSATLAVAAVVAGAAFLLVRTMSPPPCQGARERLAGVWDEDVKAGLRAAFAAAGKAYLQDTSRLVERSLDRYADAWVAMHTEACEATHVRHEQSAGLLDLRMACLDRRIEAFAALRGLLADEADEKTLRNAVQAVESLPRLERCEDREALTAAYPPPEDAEVRARLDAARGRLDRAQAMYLAGQYRPGLEVAQAIAKEAEEIGYPPFETEALHLLGQFQAENADAKTAEATLGRALAAASRARDAQLRAEARITLARVVGNEQRRYDDGLLLQTIAEEDVVYAGSDPLQEAKLANAVGTAYFLHGNFQDARSQYQRALAIREKKLGENHFRTAATVNNLAIVTVREREYEIAETLYRRALHVLEQAVGPQHPDVARTLNNLAELLLKTGEWKEALAYLERALAISEQVFGTDHPQSAVVLINLGDVYAARKQHVTARDHYRRSIHILEAKLGATAPLVGHPLTGLGKSLIADGKAADAIPVLERAVSIWLAGENDALVVAESCFALARALQAVGRDPVRARRLAMNALDIFSTEKRSTTTAADAVRHWLADQATSTEQVSRPRSLR